MKISINVDDNKGEVESWRVRFSHEPYPFPFQKYSFITTCTMADEEGNVLATGVAKCKPGDNFARTTGRRIALTKAIRNLAGNFSAGRALRKKVWAEIWKERERITGKKYVI